MPNAYKKHQWIFIFCLIIISIISCKKDNKTSYEGNYTISLTNPFEKRDIYPAPDAYTIYAGTDLTMPRVWHIEKVNDDYLISPVSIPAKVISFDGGIRPVLIDRPATPTAKELFRIEAAKPSTGLFTIKSMYFNKYISVGFCYKNASVYTFDLGVIDRGSCNFSHPGTDTCFCITDFTLQKQ